MGAEEVSRRLPWGPMARMAGRRTLFAAPVLLVVTFGVFAVAAASPFDPVKAYAGTAGLTASQDNLDQLRANLGVDQPLVTRWWDWLTAALTGDLGDSSVLRQPVADVIGDRLGWSVLLAATAFLVAIVLGTGLGVLAGRRPGGWLDRCVSSLAYTLEAAPAFWLGLLAIWFFALKLDVLPAAWTDRHGERHRHLRPGGEPPRPARPPSSASPNCPGSTCTYARASPTRWRRTRCAAPARAG